MARASAETRATLGHAVAELRDLPYSFWRQIVVNQASFEKPLPAGSGRMEVEARWAHGTRNIAVTVTLKRGWRRGVTDGFTITPTNEFR